jgi:hypothetical protein
MGQLIQREGKSGVKITVGAQDLGYTSGYMMYSYGVE